MRSLVIGSMAPLLFCLAPTVLAVSPYEMRPPIRAEDQRAYGDGGTLSMSLIDTDGRELWISVSQNAWDDAVPHETLFLDSSHFRHLSARLPFDKREYQRVVGLVRSSVPSATKEQESGYEQTFLSKIETNTQPATYDPASGAAPDWYAEYDAQRLEREKNRSAEDRSWWRFKECFPVVVRPLLSEPNIDWDIDLSERESAQLGEDPEEAAIRTRARLLAEGVGEPVWLAEIVCRAFGATGGRPVGWWFGQLVADEAMERVSPADFLAALEHIEEDREALLGASAFFFEPHFIEGFTEKDLLRWMPPIAEAALSGGLDGSKERIVAGVASAEHPGANELLRAIAKGLVGKERAPKEKEESGGWANDHLGIRVVACLALAAKGDQPIRPVIVKRLDEGVNEKQRAALEVGLALLGDAGYLREEHFGFRSRPIIDNALLAIEQFGGEHGMDVLMSAALDHPWRATRSKALQTAQRLTGQTWGSADEAKAWWAEHREEFLHQPEGQE